MYYPAALLPVGLLRRQLKSWCPRASVYEFNLIYCDAMVARVFRHIQGLDLFPNSNFLGMLAVDTVIDDRQMRALTGLDLAAFCALSEPFVAGCQQEADARFSEQRPRQRRAGGGGPAAGARACWPVRNRNYCSFCTT